MADRRVLDQLTKMLHNRPNLSSEGGQMLYEQFAQPIFDRRQQERDEEDAMLEAEEAQRKAQLADLQNMLTGSAMEQGTLGPAQVRQQAQSFGAAPQQARQMAQMVAPQAAMGGPAAGGLEPDDLADLSKVVAAASQGISPLQLASGVEAEATGQPIPTAVVASQVANMLRAQGKSEAAVAEAITHLTNGYRF